MVSSKHAFWQALLAAVLVFGLGLLVGFFLEDSRTSSVEQTLLNSEIRVLDEQLREKVSENTNISCILARQSLFDFADRIYGEAQKLEKYDASSKFSGSLLILHRRYDLLRTMLWTESIHLKTRCDFDFATVVYLYDYNPQDVEQRARQNFFSRLLVDLKERQGNEVLLIPIATNMDIASLDLLLSHYSVANSPVILINEKHRVSEVITFDDLEKLVLESNKQ